MFGSIHAIVASELLAAPYRLANADKLVVSDEEPPARRVRELIPCGEVLLRKGVTNACVVFAGADR